MQLEVRLPSRDITVKWSHPWKSSDILGLKGIVKHTECIMGEKIPSSEVKPKYRYMAYQKIKWPLYSTDGDRGHTLRFGKGTISKEKARKETLRRALQEARLSRAERVIVWSAYFQATTGKTPVPLPTRLREALTPKIEVKTTPILKFPTAIQAIAQGLIAPSSGIFH